MLNQRSTVETLPALSFTRATMWPLVRLVTGVESVSAHTEGSVCVKPAASSAPAALPFTAKFVVTESEARVDPGIRVEHADANHAQRPGTHARARRRHRQRRLDLIGEVSFIGRIALRRDRRAEIDPARDRHLLVLAQRRHAGVRAAA